MGLEILMEQRVADERNNREKCSSTFSGIRKLKPLTDTITFSGMKNI